MWRAAYIQNGILDAPEVSGENNINKIQLEVNLLSGHAHSS